MILPLILILSFPKSETLVKSLLLSAPVGKVELTFTVTLMSTEPSELAIVTSKI